MSPEAPAPVLTILGSGTLVPDPLRHSASHHLSLGSGARILLDCGPGTVHGLGLHGVRWEELTHVAITHFHTDHVGDLAALLMAFRHGLASPRSGLLTLIGPIGLHDFLTRLAAAMGDHVLDPGCELRVVELDSGEVFDDGTGFSLSGQRTPHTAASVAFRVDGPWGAVGYTGDTGPDPDLGRFLAGCDVLVAECTVPSDARADNHLSPTSLGALVRVAQPRLLVVVHVAPPLQPEAAVRALEPQVASAIAAFDGMRIRLDPSGPIVDPNVAAI